MFVLKRIVTYLVVPLPSNSHHQAYHIFSRGSQPKPSFQGKWRYFKSAFLVIDQMWNVTKKASEFLCQAIGFSLKKCLKVCFIYVYLHSYIRSNHEYTYVTYVYIYKYNIVQLNVHWCFTYNLSSQSISFSFLASGTPAICHLQALVNLHLGKDRGLTNLFSSPKITCSPWKTTIPEKKKNESSK